METKTCKKCETPKKLSEFRLLKSGNRAGTCLRCQYDVKNANRNAKGKREGITESARYRRDNPEKVTEWRQKYRRRNLMHVLNIKMSTPCADCGEHYPPVCMDFDHLDGEDKESSISALMNQGASLARIDAEIAKCELVCANCHRIRTAARGNWFGVNYGIDDDGATMYMLTGVTPTSGIKRVSSCH